MFRITILLVSYVGIGYAQNAINIRTCEYDRSTMALRCNVEEGNEYSPDRLLSGIRILELVGKFKNVYLHNEFMPDLKIIHLFGSCSAKNVIALRRLEIMCQAEEGQFVKGEETQTKETACNSELLAEIRKMQKKIDTMESQISSLAQANTADSSKCERDLHRRLLDPLSPNPGNHVAFTATHSTNASTFGAYATIIFDTVESNAGQGYNAKTGVFTCPFNGYYFFTHSALSPYNGHIETEIVLEGTPKAMIYAESSTPSTNAGSGYDQGSNSVVTYCEAGHRVWVRVHGDRGTTLYWDRYSHFSGFLLWSL